MFFKALEWLAVAVKIKYIGLRHIELEKRLISNILNKFVSEEYSIKSLDYESSFKLEQAKKKYPDWYEKRIVNGEKRNGRWLIKRDLYDWWINKIKTDPDLRVGHRYFCIAALASYAVKCGICEDELRKDAYELKDFMNNLQDDFSDDDIENALNFYHESFITFLGQRLKISRA